MNMWLEPSLAPTTHPIENWTDFLRPDSWTAFGAVVLHFCEVNTRRRTNKKQCLSRGGSVPPTMLPKTLRAEPIERTVPKIDVYSVL